MTRDELLRRLKVIVAAAVRHERCLRLQRWRESRQATEDLDVAIAELVEAWPDRARKLGAAETDGHWSDCALYNAPALPLGTCDCGGIALGDEDDGK